MTNSLLLLGGGKMGSAMLGGWLAAGIPASGITVIEPHAETLASLPVRVIKNIPELGNYRADIVIIALKPQILAEALPAYLPYLKPDTLIISIAAGKTLNFLERTLGADRPIIRTMPNLPATIRRAITAGVANAHVTAAHRAEAERLLGSIGQFLWMEQEAQMDAVTALSGSGPAYLFYFMELLVKSAEKLGLQSEVAKLLTLETIRGSVELVSQSTETLAALRQQVTSPAGTTEAGLNVLMEGGVLERLVEETVQAACRRSQELSE